MSPVADHNHIDILLSLYEGTYYIQNNIVIISRYRSYTAAAHHDTVGSAYLL